MSVRTHDDFAGAASTAFKAARRIENWYGARLRGVAAQIGHIVSGMHTGSPGDISRIAQALQRYSDLLKPWAESVGNRMVVEVSQRDERSWFKVASEMGRNLRREIETAPTGVAMRTALDRQVGLITSLPTEAAERVHKLARESLSSGARAETIAAEILRTGEVTRARANTIARTEVSRASTELTVARAQHIGCTHFIWRTTGDGRVRPSHRAMNRVVCEIASPPVVDGEPLLPGQTYNCRCWMSPIVPD